MSFRGVLLVFVDSEVQEIARRALVRIGVDIETADDAPTATAHLARNDYAVTVIARHDDDVFNAVSRRTPKPFVIATTDADMPTDIADHIVASSHDPQTVVGVILACVNERLAPPPIVDAPPELFS